MFSDALRHGVPVVMSTLTRVRHCRVKRGNLYPEQHQIGMRVTSVATGGSPKYAGRWLEYSSNGMPRGMIACRRKPVYRIRPIDLPCTPHSRFETSDLFIRSLACVLTHFKKYVYRQTLALQFTKDFYFISQSSDFAQYFHIATHAKLYLSPCCH